MPSEGGVRGVSLGDAVVTRSVQVVPVCVCVYQVCKCTTWALLMLTKHDIM